MEEELRIRRKRKKRLDKYKLRKICFWLVILALILLGSGYYILGHKTERVNRLIRVAVCGAVRKPAVYTMREGADLGMLVRKARGFRPDADMANVNLDRIVYNDSVYHIHAVAANETVLSNAFMREVHLSTNRAFSDLSKDVAAEFGDKEIRKYTILYVGLPAVYVLINYYPDFNRINFVHIPLSTLFLNNEYRLIDVFFTLDIYPTMRIIEHALKQKIDYYLIQDRYKFIDLIDMLGGVSVNLDKQFADSYTFKPGMNRLNGSEAWEYIKYLDWNQIDIKVKSPKSIDLIRADNFEVSPNTWERIYEIRNQRQRYTLQAMRKSFAAMDKKDQLYVIDHFKDVFQTDMSTSLLMDLYKDILSTKQFSFGALPGYYRSVDNKLFFYPDLPNFEMLEKEKIREWLVIKTNKAQTVY
jgi:anionic cell wall polymer biosynthesis LytR-Cps2A-Psr (LCP) family protein